MNVMLPNSPGNVEDSAADTAHPYPCPGRGLLPHRQPARRPLPEQDRHLVAIEDLPARLLEQPSWPGPGRAQPDQVDPVAVADRVPHRAAGQDVDVFEDRLLAEELEAVVDDTTAAWAGTRPRSGRPSPARGRAASASVDGSASRAPRAAISSWSKPPRLTPGHDRPGGRRASRPPARSTARSSRFHDFRSARGRPSSSVASAGAAARAKSGALRIDVSARCSQTSTWANW